MPVINITTPEDNSGVSGTSVDISGTIDDPTATIEIEVTGAATHTFAATNNGDGTFIATGVTIEGNGQKNILKATATDAATNSASSSVSVIQGWVLHLQVPYAAVTDYYSGAATSQMILNYMRNGVQNDLTQQEIYNYGHPHNGSQNSTLLEMDPQAISYALGHFDPYDLTDPTGMGDGYLAYNFGVESFESAKFTEYLRDIMHWMAYPVKQGKWWEAGQLTKWPNVPAVVPMNGTYNHWVVINGAAASENPMPEPYTNPWNTPNFTAYGLWMTDPATGGIGNDLYVTAQTAQDTILLPVTTADPYNGKYVQVAEPPEVQSKALVTVALPKVNEETLEIIRISQEIEKSVSEGLSGAEQRVEAARKHVYDAALVVDLDSDIKADANKPDPDQGKAVLNSVFNASLPSLKLDWRKIVDSSILTDENFVEAFDGSQARQFIKVRRGDQENGFYYLVPFDKYAKGQFLTYVAIIIDAQDGSFKEASWVKEPTRFIQVAKERAMELVTLEDPELKIVNSTIELTWQPGGYSQSPFYPYWKVVAGSQTYFVTQDGKVIKQNE